MKKKRLLTLLLSSTLFLSACGSIQINVVSSEAPANSQSSSEVASSESSNVSSEESSTITSDVPAESISSEGEQPAISSEESAISSSEDLSENEITSGLNSSEEIPVTSDPQFNSTIDSSEQSSTGPIDSSETSEISQSSGAPTTMFDYANDGPVKLTQEYANHAFLDDGIGQVTLMTPIDGDTAHFKGVVGSSDTIKIRFYGIDTPESTGNVEPYGKQASNFTKAKLQEANSNGTIVISSTFTEYKAPEPDSTGSRYLGLVWICLDKKNAPKEDLVLLNLWIVQEGLSYTKNVSAIPQYVDTFYAAEAQAEQFKLKMWSGEDDPYYNYGGYEDVSLLAVKNELAICFADSTHQNIYDNKKIRFTGTVVGYSNNILYVQEFYPNDPDDLSKGGQYAGINIFTGMKALPTKYTKVNTYLEICGLAQDSENFGFQVTDTESHFPRVGSSSDADTVVLLKPDENVGEHSVYTFDKSAADVSNWASNSDLTALFCYVSVNTEVTIKSFYMNASNEITLGVEGEKWNIFVAFTYYGDPEDTTQIWNQEDLFVGKKFRVTGVYAFHKTTSGKIQFQLVPSKSSELVYVG